MSNQEGQNQQQQQMSQKQRNIQNNANTVKNAADVAIASKNPYAMAAGGAVKLADKISGGRASQELGKKMNTLNKISPGGRKIQRASNMLAETGVGDAIGKAASMKSGGGGAAGGQSSSFANGMAGAAGTAASKGKSAMDKTAADEEKEQEAKESVTGQFMARLPLKVKLVILLGIVPAFCFILLFIAVVVNYVADEKAFGVFAGNEFTKDPDAMDLRDEIRDNADELGMGGEELNLPTDDELGMAEFGAPQNSTVNEFLSRTENIENIYEYFECKTAEECLKRPEVRFYIKVQDIQRRYIHKYHVRLDWDLIMSTVFSMDLDPKDMFKAFLNDYNEDDVEKYDKLMNLDWDYDYEKELGEYYLSGDYFEYDLQILAKNMVQKRTVQTCTAKKTDAEGNVTYETTKTQEDFDIEDKYLKKGQEYYLECDPGEIYSINSTYSLNMDKYDAFLLEYIENKYYLKSGGTAGNLSSYRCVSQEFPKYDLTEEQLRGIASQAYHEQGTPKGAAAEASLMANRFELYGSSHGTGADGLYSYVRDSKWFANSESNMASQDAPEDVVEAVRDVLVNGKRTLPAYIDEHDWINDLTRVTTDGKAIDIKDREAYVPHKTIIENTYNSTYTFYSFPDEGSDPFGYIHEEKREELGDFHYDFDTGEEVSCYSGTDLSSTFVNLALSQEGITGRPNTFTRWLGPIQGYPDGGYSYPWCATFVSWAIEFTEFGGQRLKDIINVRSAGVYSFATYFDQSSHVEYVRSGNYVPKEGDLIFFDWDCNYYDMSANDHIGIVIEAKDGIVYTIEGNTGDSVATRQYNLNSCEISAYGVWY